MKNSRALITFLANFFIPLAGISTDIYLPSLPALTQQFMVDKAMTQLTVTTFGLGMGLMQFIAGPISDALGRKKLFIAALITQIVAVLFILNIHSISLMIGIRFIQGVGAAFLIVPARAIISDTFTGDTLKKQFNYVTISFAMGPILGPFIGGYLQTYFGWHACFIFILVYALIALALVLLVYRESITSTHRFALSHLLHNYGTIISHRYFLVACLFASCLFSATALFNVAGPFLVQVSMGYSAITFGHMALFIGLAWFLGNVTNRILFKTNATLKVLVGLSLSCLSAITMLIFSHNGDFTLTLLMVPMFATVFANGAIFSLFTAECLTLFKDLAASANGFYFGMIWSAFALFTFIATLLKGPSLFPLAITLLSVNVFCFLVYFGLRRTQS